MARNIPAARIGIALPGVRAALAGFVLDAPGVSGKDVLTTDTGDTLVDDLGNILTA